MARPKVLHYTMPAESKKAHVAALLAAYRELVALRDEMLMSHGTKDSDVKKLHTMIGSMLAMVAVVQTIKERKNE